MVSVVTSRRVDALLVVLCCSVTYDAFLKDLPQQHRDVITNLEFGVAVVVESHQRLFIDGALLCLCFFLFCAGKTYKMKG